MSGGRPKGLPKTGGRKRGTPNRRTVQLERAMERVAQTLAEHLGEHCFPGDAHALAIAIYKDTRNDPELRLEAAKAAMPYEKPRLSAVEHSGNIGTTHEDRLFQRLAAQKAPARKHDA
jgi:hypothetical protein